MKKKIHRKNSAYSLVLTICTIIFFGNYIFIKAQTRTEINGPAGSVAFGENITLLPNGNFVVVDSQYSGGTTATTNIGAVYLYSASGTLINKITGTTGNDFVGSGGITILTGGDYVISSPRWTKAAVNPTNNAIVGAVTKCSGTAGCAGQVSAANSLIGNIDGDYVSQTGNANIKGVTALSNGNYVVRSPYWGISGFPNNTTSVGAVTFCNGATNNCAGQTVTSANSLVGSVQGDTVGNQPITVLSSGDYLVSSPGWKKSNSPAGAVTLCSRTTGCTGAVSTANSLTGAVYGSGGDTIGNSGVYALPNNLYLVASGSWNRPDPIFAVGAVTLCNATTNNCTGQIVTAANSFTGSTANDSVGINGVNILPNGDYVLVTPNWRNPQTSNQSVGAVTLCRTGTNSCAGQTVSTANSLTAAVQNSQVGFGGITVLTNGNYVVSSPSWRPSNNIQTAGAATLCLTASNSCAGQSVSAANSLVGSSFGDAVSQAENGAKGVVALTNGNYVVNSPNWSDPGATPQSQGVGVGASTWCSGTAGYTGAVSRVNSLTGSQAVDFIGRDGATALTNGGYVVNSSNWTASTSQSGFGAATLCGANNNCAGQTVSAANSLTGTKPYDRVSFNGTVALINGNYVVVSSEWDASSSITDAGAITFCNASNACAGQQVSAANSLIGSTTDDKIGDHIGTLLSNDVFALPNGNYVIKSALWNNGSITDAGAVTIGSSSTGVSGSLTSANSILGVTANNGPAITFVTDSTGNKVIIGLPKDNKVVLVGAVTPRRAPFDFDGDGKTDIGIFRPSVGEWWYQRSLDGANRAVQFGSSSDKTVPVDYTGDGKTDIAFYRPSDGNWFIIRSEDSTYYASKYGISEDVPAPGDYDGDGKADLAVYRPSSNTWFIQRSSDGGSDIRGFGATGDVPVVADYDGDGKTDIAIFRKTDNSWWHVRSSDGEFRVYQFALGTDKPVIGDWTGDGKADLATYRPTTGEWFIRKSEDLSYYAVPFGAAGDIPAPGDYDGDGKLDTAVYRPSQQVWYINGSTAGVKIITGFGIPEDKPLASSFIP